MTTERSNGALSPDKIRVSADGFTMIEVMLALVLAGLAIAVLGGAFAQATHLQKGLEGRTTAIALGQSKLAELEAGSEVGSSGDFPEPFREYHWNSQEEANGNGAKITLTVEWGDNRASIPRHKEFEGWRPR
jgi:prepilin-type N-terminal cleavage/methylation domain-containing protein